MTGLNNLFHAAVSVPAKEHGFLDRAFELSSIKIIITTANDIGIFRNVIGNV
jgi:hypothetical protein